MTKSKFSILVLAVFALIAAILPCSAFAGGELCVGKSAILIEASSGRVLYEKNAYQKLPMASTTKIATALTALKHAKCDEIVTVDKQAVGIEGSSIYLREGEKLTVEELLYGLMLRSGNDAAVALAIHVGGSVDGFVSMMNNLAKEVGAKDTSFTNPHGLHDENHYTTAFDLALITKAALQNEKFAQIVSSKNAVISNEGYEYRRNLTNKNKLLTNYEYANGVKTGYTKKAGRCFVGSAKKDGMQLIAVVLNCGPMFENAQSMLEFGFSCYTMTNIIPKNKVCGAIFDKEKHATFVCDAGFSYPLSKDELKLVDKEILLPSSVEGEGRVVVRVGGQVVFESKLTKY
jgi:D-alanyl-D-alanine carboxypeptidase (penicillin-binding protein 5/6)